MKTLNDVKKQVCILTFLEEANKKLSLYSTVNFVTKQIIHGQYVIEVNCVNKGTANTIEEALFKYNKL